MPQIRPPRTSPPRRTRSRRLTTTNSWPSVSITRVGMPSRWATSKVLFPAIRTPSRSVSTARPAPYSRREDSSRARPRGVPRLALRGSICRSSFERTRGSVGAALAAVVGEAARGDQVAYLKMRGARHLEYLSREGRRGWEQSKQGRVRRRQTKGARADGTPVVTQDVVIDEHPDPRMLDQARKAEEALADLFGLTGSTSSAGRSDPRQQTDLPPLLQLSDAILERIDAELTQPRDPQDDPQ